MFVSVFIPEARKNRTVLALVAISFAASLLCTYLPLVRELSEGIRVIVLTVVISLVAAIVCPIRDGDSAKKEVRS